MAELSIGPCLKLCSALSTKLKTCLSEFDSLQDLKIQLNVLTNLEQDIKVRLNDHPDFVENLTLLMQEADKHISHLSFDDTSDESLKSRWIHKLKALYYLARRGSRIVKLVDSIEKCTALIPTILLLKPESVRRNSGQVTATKSRDIEEELRAVKEQLKEHLQHAAEFDLTPEIAALVTHIEDVTSGTPENLRNLTAKGFREIFGVNSDITAIGIDLGTSKLCVAVVEDGKPKIIPNEYLERCTPSYVLLNELGSIQSGTDAKRGVSSATGNTIYNIKKLLGRKFDEFDPEEFKHFPFKIVKAADDLAIPLVEVKIFGEKKRYTIQTLVAMLIAKAKEIAERYLGKTVRCAVITVPANFSLCQIQATKEAAAIADLCVRIVPEPTAACMAYGFQHLDEESDNRVLVFDIGGGTLDVSVVHCDENVFEVRSTFGDMNLGGNLFDNNLVDHFAKKIKSQSNGFDIYSVPKDLQRLQRACEQAKCLLSTMQATTVELYSLSNGMDFVTKLTRQEFDCINEDAFKRCIAIVDSAMCAAHHEIDDINEVVLIGGSSRVPRIQEMLSNYFGGKELSANINPDEAVALGAAIHGAVLLATSDEDCFGHLLLLDVNPFTIGLKSEESDNVGFTVCIRSNFHSIPCKSSVSLAPVHNDQQYLLLEIFTSDSAEFKTCENIGVVVVKGPFKSSGPGIAVSIDVDVNLVVSIIVQNRTTDERRRIHLPTFERLPEGVDPDECHVTLLHQKEFPHVVPDQGVADCGHTKRVDEVQGKNLVESIPIVPFSDV